jgi:SAM-dependent methyltransferase
MLVDPVLGHRRKTSAHQEVFDRIHAAREWGDSESVSGPGSGLARTGSIREALSALLRELEVERLLDAGCGDFHWLRVAELPVREYVGVDVVPDLIAEVIDRYAEPGRRFEHADITCDRLPRTDFVLCREVLMHFPDEDVLAAVTNLKRTRAPWLLTTTFVDRPANETIELGAWRALNLEAPPFSFPPPLRTFEDIPLVDREQFLDKRLALWELPALL